MEVCFCPPPLAEERAYWKEYFELLCVKDAHEKAEDLVQAANPKLQHGAGDRAFYRPSTDCIHLPLKEQFPSAGDYYSTLLHELGHWTGHATRLNRDLSDPFGSIGYVREELRAEIARLAFQSFSTFLHHVGDICSKVD
jgi:antirestriction protein ArdC